MTAGSSILKTFSWANINKKRNRSGSGGEGEFSQGRKFLVRKLSGLKRDLSSLKLDDSAVNKSLRPVEFKHTWPVEKLKEKASEISGKFLGSKNFNITVDSMVTTWNVAISSSKLLETGNSPKKLEVSLNLISVKGISEDLVEDGGLDIQFSFGVFSRKKGGYRFRSQAKFHCPLKLRRGRLCIGETSISLVKGDFNSSGDVIFQAKLSVKTAKFEAKQSTCSDLLPDYMKNISEPENCYIIAENVEFPVHKEIVRKYSSVLDEMFKQKESDADNLSKTKNERLVIEHVSPPVVETVLNFLYKEELNRTLNDDMIEELLQASDLLQISSLKRLCSDYLITHIDVGNVSSVLLMAHRTNSENLKADVLTFCKLNIDFILKTPCWTHLETCVPELWSEVVSSVSPHTCRDHTKCLRENSNIRRNTYSIAG